MYFRICDTQNDIRAYLCGVGVAFVVAILRGGRLIYDNGIGGDYQRCLICSPTRANLHMLKTAPFWKPRKLCL